MLQTFLQNALPALQDIAIMIIPLAMLLAFSAKRSRALAGCIWWGVAMGSAGALTAAILRSASMLRKREVFEGWVLVFALVIEMITLFFCWRAYMRGYPEDTGRVPKWSISLFPIGMILYQGLDFFLFCGKVLFPEGDIVWVNLALQVSGLLFGVLLAVLTGFAVFRVAFALPVRELVIGTTVSLVVVMAQQSVIVIQVLLARGILPMKKWLMASMIPLINHPNWFFFALLGVALLLPIFLFLQRKPAQPDGLNPAQYRKILAAARKQLRWGVASLASVLLVLFLASAGKAYADQKVELSPAVPVVAQKGDINIALETVSDSKLHRFSYTASNGTVMRFIIIKKSGSAYGVGLDACDICGPTGYYERDGNVICKLCDVVMNKATIGFKGGCNPVPLTFKVAAGKIVIPAEVLEKEKKRFR